MSENLPSEFRTVLTEHAKAFVAELHANPLAEPRSWFNNVQAAHYMSLDPGTLSLLRSRGQGPRWTGSGKLTRYKRSDIDDYFASLPTKGGDSE